jgi:transcription elongation factor Elf1
MKENTVKCPHCGSEADVLPEINDENTNYEVMCTVCFLMYKINVRYEYNVSKIERDD